MAQPLGASTSSSGSKKKRRKGGTSVGHRSSPLSASGPVAWPWLPGPESNKRQIRKKHGSRGNPPTNGGSHEPVTRHGETRPARSRSTRSTQTR